MKKGDRVNFKTGKGIHKQGIIVGVVKAGEFPKLEKFKDLHKRGLSQAKPKDKKTFLVSDEIQLYWPTEVF